MCPPSNQERVRVCSRTQTGVLLNRVVLQHIIVDWVNVRKYTAKQVGDIEEVKIFHSWTILCAQKSESKQMQTQRAHGHLQAPFRRRLVCEDGRCRARAGVSPPSSEIL